MRKFLVAASVFFTGLLGFVGIAGAQETPVVDPEAEATALFTEHAPTVVAVVLAVAGFSITMMVLKAAIRKIGGALNKS